MIVLSVCFVSLVASISVWLLIHTGKQIREDARNGDL